MYDKNNIPRPEPKADYLEDLPEPVRTERMKRKKTAHDPLVKINAAYEATHH